MNGVLACLSLLRPHHWVKSGFVFIGLLFGRGWDSPTLVGEVLLAAFAFALTASAVYIMNDIVDRESDLHHPEKRQRPVATGVIGVPQAVLLAVLCLVAGLSLATAASLMVLAIVGLYVALNIGYSAGLKHVVLLDVFIIAAGFMLRILAGTLGVGIAPSHWLLLCGLMLTLFLGFAKRRAELLVLAGRGARHRRVLEDYTPVLLDTLIGISAAGTIVSYSLYTVAAETIAMHGTGALIYTVPFVVYGVFRYLFIVHRRNGGGDPAVALLGDTHLIVAMFCWLLCILALLR